jgi:hypothetical protein
MNSPGKGSDRGTVAGLTDAEMQRTKIIDQDNSVIVVYKPGRTSKSQKEHKSQKERKGQKERTSQKYQEPKLRP